MRKKKELSKEQLEDLVVEIANTKSDDRSDELNERELDEEEIDVLAHEAYETEDAGRLDQIARIKKNDFRVLVEVAKNKNTSAKTLHYIIRGNNGGGINGANANVFFSVCANGNLDESDMWHLLHTYKFGRGMISINPNVTSKMKQFLVAQNYYY